MNQIDIPNSQYYLNSNCKKNGPPNIPGKKFVFQSEISTYSLIFRLFYFQKYRNFIGSRGFSNQTKLGIEYHQCS